MSAGLLSTGCRRKLFSPARCDTQHLKKPRVNSIPGAIGLGKVPLYNLGNLLVTQVHTSS